MALIWRESAAYCQLLKVWFGQRGASSWQQNVNYVNKYGRQSAVQPLSGSVRHLSTEPTSEDFDQIPLEKPLQRINRNEPVNVKSQFRTAESDVLLHQPDHEGLYYNVSREAYKKYYMVGQRTQFRKQVSTFRECGVMIRKPALEIFEIADSADLDLPPLRIFLYGKYGYGKTMTLCHVVHRLATQGFVTVHFPNIKQKIRLQPQRKRKMLFSEDEQFIDHTFDAVQWLTLFKMQNKTKLKEVKISEDYVFTVREKIEQGAALIDLIEFGISRRLFASRCVGLVLAEVRRAATEKQIKVAVALDGANVFWKNLAFDINRKYPAQMCTFFLHFMEMFQPTWNNGIIVGTLCSGVAAVDVAGLDPRKMDSSPYNILQKEGFKFMDPFIPVEVPRYSKEEAINCLDYYIDNHWVVLPEGKTKNGKEELIALTAKHPLELMHVCNYW